MPDSNKDESKPAGGMQLESISSPRLPPPNMSESNIESYFMSLEFWFAATGIGGAVHDTRKFNIVMAQVPPSKLTELRSIIDGVPTSEKYTYVKRKLIDHFADSQQRRLQLVLSDMPLGDMKPSKLFNDMRRVAGDSLSENVLLDLWASRLPPYAQAAVIASKGDAAERTTIADAIVESMSLRNISTLDSVLQTEPSTSQSVPEKSSLCSIESLQREIAQLSSKLEKVLSSRCDNTFRGRARSHSRNGKRGWTYRDKTPQDEQCWYHRVFGNEAHRCRMPCSFSQSNKQ
ncbi:uncharacterized protein LOC131428602 [Malaya genurostris]|uniref:uncharacterized protein LOC131428602 n=1 Tax=Malaya genurostris TaxID=325434 RepID=UPI0026F406F1|nr:uncharacterized protein LOC131428602 [Malaya genurostris]